MSHISFFLSREAPRAYARGIFRLRGSADAEPAVADPPSHKATVGYPHSSLGSHPGLSAEAGKNRQGFTLIELLLVVGIIVILAAIVVVALNPTKQIGEGRNAQRRSDVNTILNAIYQYTVDNRDSVPGYLSGATAGRTYQVCNCNSIFCMEYAECGLPVSDMINLRALTGTYLVSIPRDPLVLATATGSRYLISRDSQNRITVAAPDAENGVDINVTR